MSRQDSKSKTKNSSGRTNLRVLVTCANFGGIDEVPRRRVPPSEAHVDYVDDASTLPLELLHKSARARGKYFKMCAHRTLAAAGVEFLVWVDASIELRAGAVNWLVKQLGDADCAFFRHSRRSTVAEELAFCVEQLQKGDAYLLDRYSARSLAAQVSAYKLQGFDPTHASLYECGLFIRRNSPAVNGVFDAWYTEQGRSLQDQLSLPFVLWKAGSALRVKALPGTVLKGPYHNYHGHGHGHGFKSAASANASGKPAELRSLEHTAERRNRNRLAVLCIVSIIAAFVVWQWRLESARLDSQKRTLQAGFRSG